MATDLINPLSSGSLDLDEIKTSLKQYLIDNSVIKDVNYLGSNISILIDIMAYSILNVNATTATSINQMMLPLADIRSNIIQAAQNIGYSITRRISSKMNVTFSYDVNAGQNITIPAYTSWKCGDYTFVNDSDIIITETEAAVDVDLIEGEVIDSSIDPTLEKTLTSSQYAWTLNYQDIENDSIRVYVQFAGDTEYGSAWTKVDYFFSLDGVNTYFHESYDADTEWVLVETAFADVGFVLGSGDKIKFLFLISSGSAANGIGVCEQTATILDNTDSEVELTVTVNSVSRGGQDEEADESVQENAPIYYNSGGRTVNEYDYASNLIKSSIVDTAVSWGGENHIPEMLGHIYFSAIPQDPARDYISTLNEASLLDLLSKVRIVSTYRHFWQPQYIVLDFDIKILGTPVSIVDKQTSINAVVDNYFDSYANKFLSNFYISKLVSRIEAIFDSDASSTAVVFPYPKIRLDPELFISNLDDSGDLIMWIPNSPKRWYLTKGSERVEIPENETDLNTYIVNGWVKTYDSAEELDISFSGTINGNDITTVDNMDDTKTIWHNGIAIGTFHVQDSYLVIDSSFEAEVISDGGTSHITMNYSITVDGKIYPSYFNVKALKNTYISKGVITYV